jgi:hypothetical protein
MKYYAALTIKLLEFEAEDIKQANKRLNYIEKVLSDNGILQVPNNWELIAIQQPSTTSIYKLGDTNA